MPQALETLHAKSAWIVDTKAFDTTFGTALFLIPLVLLPQTWGVWHDRAVEGIAPLTFVMLGTMQFITILYGIKKEDWRFIIVFAFASIQSMSICIGALLYA